MDGPNKVLIVDDNQDSRELVCKILKRQEGVLVVEAVDGEDALSKARTELPDLILMDISLPKIYGHQVTRTLKGEKEFEDVPIIALTAHAMKGDCEKAMAAGCAGYISKPIDVRNFYDQIKQFF